MVLSREHHEQLSAVRQRHGRAEPARRHALYDWLLQQRRKLLPRRNLLARCKECQQAHIDSHSL